MTEKISPDTGEIVQDAPRLDENGWEVLDPNPVEVPIGAKRPETLAEQVQRLVRTSVSAYAQAQGEETWEEAEDFDVEDDFDPSTPYETFFDPVLGKDISPAEFKANADRYREEYVRMAKNYWRLREQDEQLTGAGRSPAAAHAGPEARPAEQSSAQENNKTGSK